MFERFFFFFSGDVFVPLAPSRDHLLFVFLVSKLSSLGFS